MIIINKVNGTIAEFSKNTNSKLIINNNGTVGINNSNPNDNYSLDVIGGALFKTNNKLFKVDGNILQDGITTISGELNIQCQVADKFSQNTNGNINHTGVATFNNEFNLNNTNGNINHLGNINLTGNTNINNNNPNTYNQNTNGIIKHVGDISLNSNDKNLTINANTNNAYIQNTNGDINHTGNTSFSNVFNLNNTNGTI
jgi:hypothetical protein